MRHPPAGTQRVPPDAMIDPPRRVLVEFRDCASGRAAMLQAAEIARRNHSCLVVVLVLGRPWYVDTGFPLAVTPATAGLEERDVLGVFGSAVDALPGDVSVVSVVCRGSVRRALAHVASEQCCDVVVIGCSRRWQLWRRSVERYLRRRLAGPVIVVSDAESPLAGLSGADADRSSGGRLPSPSLAPRAISLSASTRSNFGSKSRPPEVTS